jgi:hypothetical protein
MGGLQKCVDRTCVCHQCEGVVQEAGSKSRGHRRVDPMKIRTRRTALRIVGTALAAPAIARYAQAAEIRWRLGHVAPLDTPLHQRLTEASDAISKRSDGQMELSIIGEGRAGIQSG